MKRLLTKLRSPEVFKLVSVFVDQFFMSLSTLLTSIVLARTYDKLAYADIVLLFSINIFILGFQSSIISKPYAINLNDAISKKENNEYFHFSVLLKLLFNFLIVLVFPFIFFLSFDAFSFSKLCLFLAYIISHGTYFFVREVLLSERKTKQNLVYGLLCSTGIITLLIFIYLKGIKEVSFFLISASAIYVVLFLIYASYTIRFKLFSFSRFGLFFRRNWQVGSWMLGSNVFFFLSSSIYPWILLYCDLKVEIAILGVLMSVGSIINPILTALSAYLLPFFVKFNGNYKKLKHMAFNWTKVFIGLSLLLLLVGGFYGQEIIVLMFGKKYAGLGLIAFFPFLVQAINVSFQPMKITLNAIKRTDINFWILVPRSVIAIFLGYVLVQNFGLVGVFYTMIIENTFYQILNFALYRKILNVSPND